MTLSPLPFSLRRVVALFFAAETREKVRPRRARTRASSPAPSVAARAFADEALTPDRAARPSPRALSQVMPLGDPAELREHIAPDQLLAAVGGEDEYEFDPDDRPEPWLR